jgi:hypothetical protein
MVESFLQHQPVGLYPIAEETWLLKYGPVVLGTIKGEAAMQRLSSPVRKSAQAQRTKMQNCNPCHRVKLLPMSPVAQVPKE